MKKNNTLIGGSSSLSGKADLQFLLLVILLSVCGTLMVFSAGYAYAEFRYDDGAYFIKKQAIWLALGIAVMIISSHFKPSFYKFMTVPLYAVTVILLLLVLIVGFAGNGAQRWISLGPITVQPSEIAKMTMVMALAYYFSKYESYAAERGKRGFVFGTAIPLSIIVIPIVLVMLQKHLSCIIILGIIGLLVITVSGTNTKYIRLFTVMGAVGVCCLALFTDYTKDRITVWQDPESYKLTGGWQTLQGLMAIGSGGLFGLGFGKSLLKYCYVSEPANDMIFAILCEEFGFVGAALTLLCFAYLTVRGYKLALRQEDIFAKLVIFGIITKIALQTLLNVAVVTNTIPNTGISLPFFSYGGSSLIMIFFEIGMVLSFSRYTAIRK